MKNRFVIVDDHINARRPQERGPLESDESLLKKTDALTFEGAYGDLLSNGSGDWALIKAEICKKERSKNPA